jgi:hypothetical protein
LDADRQSSETPEFSKTYLASFINGAETEQTFVPLQISGHHVREFATLWRDIAIRIDSSLENFQEETR